MTRVSCSSSFFFFPNLLLHQIALSSIIQEENDISALMGLHGMALLVGQFWQGFRSLVTQARNNISKGKNIYIHRLLLPP
jgi:hypothetical protein